MHLAFTFAAIATAIAVVASALRGRRYLHSPAPAAEPVAAELAEGAAEAAALVGLDDASMLPDDNGASWRSREGNGVHAASASSGAETELGVSAENG